MQNPQPKLYQPYTLSLSNKQARLKQQLDEKNEDPFDELEIFQLIRYINDPQYPLTLEQLNVVQFDKIFLYENKIVVNFTPTIPHCSMAQMIGLMIKVKLCKYLPTTLKNKVLITPGSHVNQLEVNKQINDKQRIAAAMENPNIVKIINRGYYNSDRYEF